MKGLNLFWDPISVLDMLVFEFGEEEDIYFSHTFLP